MSVTTVIVFIVSCTWFVKGEICSEMKCSNIIDYVCGIAERGSIKVINTYQNICHLNKIKCKLISFAHVYRISDSLCNIVRKEPYENVIGRRLHDFSIVGAHQACNHTCPTHCVDTYEPACAQIWTTEDSFKYRPMINHCHIDMLSCATGVNVTIEPLAKCYKNPSGLMFMSQVAAMKSLKLIDDSSHPSEFFTHIRRKNRRGFRRLADTLEKVFQYQK